MTGHRQSGKQDCAIFYFDFENKTKFLMKVTISYQFITSIKVMMLPRLIKKCFVFTPRMLYKNQQWHTSWCTKLFRKLKKPGWYERRRARPQAFSITEDIEGDRIENPNAFKIFPLLYIKVDKFIELDQCE